MAFDRDSRKIFVNELSFEPEVYLSLYSLDRRRILLRFFDPATFVTHGRMLLHPKHVAYRGDAHSPSPSFLSHSKVVSRSYYHTRRVSRKDSQERSYKESSRRYVVNYKRWIKH